MRWQRIMWLGLCLFSLPLSAQAEAMDASLEELLATDVELQADVGSRSGARALLENKSPVDVITHEQLEASGWQKLTDALRHYVPGFNAPETSVADGSDHVRVFTLRGMAPDQVLVLVNGKRLHQGALLHVNGVIGRGSSQVDLDTIALKSIERVEILRDGAAAQYGSDAIAGVINIVLKGMGESNEVSLRSSAYSKGDGKNINTEILWALPLARDGFINSTLSIDRQQQTWRGGLDRRLSVPRVDTHVGLPAADNGKAVIHGEMPLANGLLPYLTVIGNRRDSRASAFYRPPSASNTMLYPGGFLPMIHARINDISLLAGIRGDWGDHAAWDFSHTYGFNSFAFNVDHSMNYSLAGSSPTSFRNGKLGFTQQTSNLDIRWHGEQWHYAVGLEHRSESYAITAGEQASWVTGGSQGFSGFRPENAVAGSRQVWAAYADGDYDVSRQLQVEAALRGEHYSDFGGTGDFKLAANYRLLPTLSLRTGTSTGFRAPSLSQLYYSQTSSFVDTATNTLVRQGTFRPNDPLAIALGAKPLKPEKSEHLTLGLAFQPDMTLSMTVDYYFTRVRDRIMLSNDLSGTTPAQAAILAANNVSQARFFTNGLDTTTQGVDARLDQTLSLRTRDDLTLGLWFHYNRNHVSQFKDPNLTRTASFDQIDRLENGQPKTGWRLHGRYQWKPLALGLSFNRYGSYRQVIGGQPYHFKARWTIDSNLDWQISKAWLFSMGGHNLLGTQPNRWPGLSGTFYGFDGIKPWSRYSPFGYSGASYYARLTARF